MKINGYWTPSSIHNLAARIADGEYHFPPCLWGSEEKHLRNTLRPIARNRKLVSANTIDENDIFAEQLLYEAVEKTKGHRSTAPRPIIHMVIEHVSPYYSRCLIFCAMYKLCWRKNVTWNSPFTDAMRKQFEEECQVQKAWFEERPGRILDNGTRYTDIRQALGEY